MPTNATNWDNCLEVASITDVGMRRSNNQDSHVVLLAADNSAWESRGHMFVVADGMGAHAAGELASRLAADGITHHYYKYPQLSPPEAIARAIRDTNDEIHRRGEANSEFHNMGTTCSCLLLLPQGALAAHVGDSRVYRARGNRLQQLTFDHSLVWEMRAAGQIKGSGSGIPRNVITRSLGPNAIVKPDVEGPFRVQVGDRFLVCSDGLMARVEDEEIGLVLAVLPTEEAAQFLVDLTNVRGGPDNSTLIVTHVTAELGDKGKRFAPLVVGGEMKPETRIHPALWFIFSASLLVAVGLLLTDLTLFGAIAGTIAALTASVIAFQSTNKKDADGGIALSEGRRLGQAPYLDIDCSPKQATVTALVESVKSQVAMGTDIAPGTRWDRVKTCLDEALEKSKSGEFVESFQLTHVALRIMLNKS
ncbi:MAG: serine/threonine-protein phosphatase [Planctomycetales bacterium]|nr:serine/threonine-protein phosphatase [Planctomycetales bacterium]